MNKVIIFTLLATLGGSAIPVAAKVGLEVFGPFTMAVFRFALSCAVLWFLVPSGERGLKTASKLRKISLVAALNPILLFIALQFTEASIVPLLYSSIPIMIAIYMFSVRGERLARQQVVGLAMGIIGIGIITTLPLLEGEPDTTGFWANGLVLLACVFVMFFGVWTKTEPEAVKRSPATIVYHFSLMALVLSLPFAAYEVISADSGALDSFGMRHAIAAVAVGSASVLGYVAQQHVIKIASATSAFMTGYLQPIVTAGLAVVFLDEILERPVILAGIIAVYGAWLVQRYDAQVTD